MGILLFWGPLLVVADSPIAFGNQTSQAGRSLINVQIGGIFQLGSSNMASMLPMICWAPQKADVHGNRGNPDYWRVQMASKVTTVAFQELFNLGMAQSCEHTRWILKVTDFQTMF